MLASAESKHKKIDCSTPANTLCIDMSDNVELAIAIQPILYLYKPRWSASYISDVLIEDSELSSIFTKST